MLFHDVFFIQETFYSLPSHTESGFCVNPNAQEPASELQTDLENSRSNVQTRQSFGQAEIIYTSLNGFEVNECRSQQRERARVVR